MSDIKLCQYSQYFSNVEHIEFGLSNLTDKVGTGRLFLDLTGEVQSCFLPYEGMGNVQEALLPQQNRLGAVLRENMV